MLIASAGSLGVLGLQYLLFGFSALIVLFLVVLIAKGGGGS